MNRKSTTQATIATRSGQALVEFAIIAFVLSAILAGLLGILVLGLGSFQNNIAAENAGRVLDQHPALIKENFAEFFADDPTDPFDITTDGMDDLTARQIYRFLNEYVIDGDDVDRRLYNERHLIIAKDDWDNRENLKLSALNESLLGQYIYDYDLVPDGKTEPGAYRYPGAVVQRTVGEETYQTVMIPLLPKEADEPLTPIIPPYPDGPRGIERSFSVRSSEPEFFYPVSDDWVAPVVVGKHQEGKATGYRLILFHPSQPASMIQVRVSVDENGRPDPDGDGYHQFPIEADDVAVDNLIGDPPSGYSLVVPADSNSGGRASPYGGRFGLGQSYAFVKTLRPYRAVFESSSLFRMTNAPVVANTAYVNPPQSGDDDRPPLRMASIAPVIVQYSAAGSQISLLDRTEVVETTDTAVAPFDFANGAYDTARRDQSLNFESLVVEAPAVVSPVTSIFSSRRYFTDFPISPPASSGNDFVHNVLRILPDDEGVWRIRVSAEFEFVQTGATTQWSVHKHELSIRLYRNGIVDTMGTVETLIDKVELEPSAPKKQLIENEIFVRVSRGDILQLRVLTDDRIGSPPAYSVRLTGTPLKNWVLFERIGD